MQSEPMHPCDYAPGECEQYRILQRRLDAHSWRSQIQSRPLTKHWPHNIDGSRSLGGASPRIEVGKWSGKKLFELVFELKRFSSGGYIG